MKNERMYKPKRHLRHELYSLSAVMLAPLIVALVFPYRAVGWKSTATEMPRDASCAFIVLSEEQEDAAIRAARSDIKTALEGFGHMRTDLSISAIPEETGCVADVGERIGAIPGEGPLAAPLPLPPSLAAPNPSVSPRKPQDATPALPFPRKHMLELR